MDYEINRKVTHPGDILLNEFLIPMEITQSALAESISVDFRTVNEIVNCKRSITANTALRLGKFFGVPPELWLNLQSQYDISVTRLKISDELDKIPTKVAC